MGEEICGISFPFHVNSSGGFALVSGPEKLRENIKNLLMTDVGERVMRRDFGGGLRQLIHDPNNDALRAIVQHQITKAIEQWEPRIQVQGLNIGQEQKQGMLIIQLLYIIRQTQQPQGLSLPFGPGGINV